MSPGLMQPASAAEPELRGTWVTTTANHAISSPENTALSMKQLREIGLNTVYVEVWKNGYTEFPSPTLKAVTGVDMKINPSPDKPALQRDLLQETLIEAHRNSLVYIAWFEYGFMAAVKGTSNELAARQDWLSRDKNGDVIAKNGFIWLNPLHPDAQDLLIGIVKDAIVKYDIDGIQLDDRIVWPYIDMGYDDFTRNMYKQETGRDAPDDPREPKWVEWRMQKVEAFSKRFVREMREAGGPDLIISLSPGPHPWAMENYLIDWPSWSRWTDNPTWDEYIPQVYRFAYDRFAKDWREQVEFMGEGNKDLIAGIRLVGEGDDCREDEVAKHAEVTRETKSMGHCWWYSRGVLDVFPKLLTEFYDVANKGHAPHPKRPADWRPAPVVAKKHADGHWHTTAPTAGTYRLIVKANDSWSQQGTVTLDAGQSWSTDLEGVDAAELLIQRRKLAD
ncbi:MAG TPA: family 10 glycosylhydrolase [Tepidisphaeraceae bacterium]|nr:family 10 glycosylhydrolase [Tepidisphaeraceae bacterium]